MELGFEQKGADGGPLCVSALRMLVPPLRLMSAVMWRVVKQREVMQYGLLADFVALVTEAVPELFSPIRGVELILGLRAKLILELCHRDSPVDIHTIQPHLNSIQLSLPLVKCADSSEVGESVFHFLELVQGLIKGSEVREHFFQHVFPVKFGHRYDSELQTLMWDFLSRLERFLPVPDLLQTVDWLSSESSAIKDCEESINNPDNLRSLLRHHKCLGQQVPCASSRTTSMGDYILSALSGKRGAVDQLSTGSSLEEPPEGSDHTQIPVCDMDGTDSEVVVSEWTEIELGADQDGESDPQTTSECGSMLQNSDLEPKVAQSKGSAEGHELSGDGGNNTDIYSGESYLKPNQDYGSTDAIETSTGGNLCHRTMEENKLDCNPEERHNLPCNTSQTLESINPMPVDANEEAAVAVPPFGARRSARKPKKTWKITMVNLQKHERKSIVPNVVNLQKMKRKPVVTTTNFEALTEMDTDHSSSSFRDTEELDDLSPDDVSTYETNTDMPSEIFYCPQCPYTNTLEKYLKSHIKKAHLGQVEEDEKEPHTCQVCGKGFRYPGMLKAHERTHTGEQPFQCTASHCGRRFSHIQALRRHRLIHTPKASQATPDDTPLDPDPENEEFWDNEPQMYNCLYCHESFSSLSARREHHKTHPEKDLNRCNECGKQLSCQAALIRHKRGHMDRRLHKCTLCDSTFKCTTSFKRHMLMHQPERPYQCSCGKGFTYRGALLSHERTHTVDRPYRCSHCDKSFLYPGALRKHEWTHSKEKPYLCAHCGKNFKRERTLRSHMAGHTKEKIFKCPMCDKTFAYKASLTRHELTHTGERPFLCSECGKTFFSFGELLKHQRYHTGHKPFQCLHCEKSFTQACYLQLHMRYHTGVRPYICPHCNKSFFTSCRLKRHVQIHTGEKPFECTECGKKFREAYVLKVHQRTHAGVRAETIVTNDDSL